MLNFKPLKVGHHVDLSPRLHLLRTDHFPDASSELSEIFEHEHRDYEMTEILGLCGSLRRNSFNRKLLREAARVFGADLKDANLRLPLFDEDLEEDGIPAEVSELYQAIQDAPAVLIATPEYNQRMSAVLKNAFDWVSRIKGNPWKDKPVAIMSATAGRSGGARAQFDLRLAMVPYRVNIVTGPEVLVGSAREHFDENGRLITESYIAFLTDAMEHLKRATAS